MEKRVPRQKSKFRFNGLVGKNRSMPPHSIQWFVTFRALVGSSLVGMATTSLPPRASSASSVSSNSPFWIPLEMTSISASASWFHSWKLSPFASIMMWKLLDSVSHFKFNHWLWLWSWLPIFDKLLAFKLVAWLPIQLWSTEPDTVRPAKLTPLHCGRRHWQQATKVKQIASAKVDLIGLPHTSQLRDPDLSQPDYGGRLTAVFIQGTEIFTWL